MAKTLVHRSARCPAGGGQNLARARHGQSSDAERLYERLGWMRVALGPGYALMPDGLPCDTMVFY